MGDDVGGREVCKDLRVRIVEPYGVEIVEHHIQSLIEKDFEDLSEVVIARVLGVSYRADACVVIEDKQMRMGELPAVEVSKVIRTEPTAAFSTGATR